MFHGTVGSLLTAFRVDGSAAITSAGAPTVVVVDVKSGATASVTVKGQLGEAVRLR
jgi:hypothetical protein